ncbi:MAG: DNA polymerase III subunit delta' [Acidobacteriia bacterium]|nr:DNA polymerase III subunit delta' [Terriglobia bacterium]
MTQPTNPLPDFMGNEHIIQTLRRALSAGRLPHAMLFTGPEGVGKRTLALRISKALNCLKGGEEFCGECSSCRKIEAGSHPDVVWVTVEEGKQFLQIDQIRRAREDVFFQPFEGRYRIFIFDAAERMRSDAANSILKMLEEPPPQTKLFLLTSNFHSLLPTIRSRCQIFSFSPLPLSIVRRALDTRTEMSTPDRDLCARLAQGSIGRALSLDLELHRTLRAEVFEFLRGALTPRSAGTTLALAESMGKDKESFEDRLNILYGLIHDVFYLLHRGDPAFLTNIDLLADLTKLSARVDEAWVDKTVATLDVIREGLRRSINRRMALEDLSFVMAEGALPEPSATNRRS